MSRHERLLSRAVALAETSQHRWMLGAVVAQGNRILGQGTNKFRNFPWIDHVNATEHAEMAALRGSLLPGQ